MKFNNIIYFGFKVINDQDCRIDMESLPIICPFCDWNDIFKSYPVI